MDDGDNRLAFSPRRDVFEWFAVLTPTHTNPRDNNKRIADTGTIL